MSKLIHSVSMPAIFMIVFAAAASPVSGQTRQTPSINGFTLIRKFDLGPGRASTDETRILEKDIYNKSIGFGFEPGADIQCFEDDCLARKASYFSVAVPEGNYRVTVKSSTGTIVKAELRRLMLQSESKLPVPLDPITRSFVVNVRRPQISTGGEVKLKDRERTSEQWAWDEKLTLEFNGFMASIRSIEIESVNVPTVFLLGDSTVCDQPGEPYASWGQMITFLFGDKVAVANHAESGESLKSSLGAKRLDKVLSLMKRGDYLLIQYGHNDEKEKGEGVGAFTTYKASLKQYVRAAKAKGATVILINPMHRRTFDTNGKITNSHGDYPEAVRQAAREEKVAFIDLTRISKDLYEALGPARSTLLFKEGDGTHHNSYGAFQIAKAIVQSIRDQRLPIAKFLKKNLPKYDPRHPDKFFTILASPTVSNLEPLGN